MNRVMEYVILAILIVPIALVVMFKVNVWAALIVLSAAFFLEWVDHRSVYHI